MLVRFASGSSSSRAHRVICIEVTCLVFSMVVVILLHTDKVAKTHKSEKWVFMNGLGVSALGMRVAGLGVTVKEHVDIRMGIAPTKSSEFIFYRNRHPSPLAAETASSWVIKRTIMMSSFKNSSR